MKKKAIQQLSASAKLAQELIAKEVRLPKEVSKVSIVYHCVSHSNKPYRILSKYRLGSLAGANPHVQFQKIVFNKTVNDSIMPTNSVKSNNNFITVEMIDGTQKKFDVSRKEVDMERVVQKLLDESQKLSASVDVSLARLLQDHQVKVAMGQAAVASD